MATSWIDYWPGFDNDVQMRCASRDGATVVEVVSLSYTNGRDVQWLRVKRHGFYGGSVRTVAELENLGIDLLPASGRMVTSAGCPICGPCAGVRTS